jgi:quercetin dioxygenase-like cupin family protein
MENVMKRIVAGALALGLCTAAATLAVGQHGGGHTMVRPSDLKWSDVPSLPPGAKIAVIEGPMNQAVPFTIRLKFPKNYQIPAHSHPAIERVTVLSGTFHMGTGDKLDKSRTHALPAGSIAIMPIGTNHYVWTSDEVIVQLNGTGPWGINYVNPADDPRKQ